MTARVRVRYSFLMAMTSINISLPEAMKEYVEEQASSGAYSTVSEYFRELVRADRKRKAEAKLEELLLEGINSGPATEMKEADWERHRQNLRDHLRKREFA